MAVKKTKKGSSLTRFLIGKHPDKVSGARHATNYHGNVSHQLITTIIVIILAIYAAYYLVH